MFEWTWIITALIALVTYLIVNQIVKVRGLPPGPIPLPLIGNMLSLRSKKPMDDLISEWRATYGDVFTLWMGMDPMIVVCGWDKLKEGLVTRKNAFSGRKLRKSGEMFLDGHNDVMIGDFGPCWETLRKLLFTAVRKYAVSDKLPILIDDSINQIVPLMLAEEDGFDPHNFSYLVVYNILASTAFRKRYDMNDEEFLSLKRANDLIAEEFSIGTLVDVYPFLECFFYFKMKRLTTLINQIKDPIANQFKIHKETYTPGVIRDFTDACLATKEEAEKEENVIAEHFTDGNMTLVIGDLFSAGTDTTRITLNWVLLYLSNYPDMQEKIRNEVKENIGDRAPIQDDKHSCPYTLAFITEILRVRPVVSFTLEHKAIQNSTLGIYNIPKDITLVFHIFSQHMDPAFWEDPKEFRPERFLETDGTFMTTSRFTGYLPFSLGRRACPGEKLALADLFLLITGLIRKCRFSLPNGPGSGDLEPQNIMFVNMPKPFKIKAEKV